MKKWLKYIFDFVMYRWGGGKERQAEIERRMQVDKILAGVERDLIKRNADIKADQDREKSIDELQDTEDF